MMEFLKKYKFETLAIIILIFATLFWIGSGKDSALAPGETTSKQEETSAPAPASVSPQPPEATPPPSTTKQSSPLKIVGIPLPGKTYQEAIQLYLNRRMQFDDTCRAIPNFMTFKNGPEIMFDNRSAAKKIIRLNGSSFVIGPYGFIVLKITSSQLPYTVKLDCGQLYNVATINLQK